MKLVVSNIAWTAEEEPAVAGLLQELGVKYVEVALTKIWQDPAAEATDTQIKEYKRFWQNHGIEIVAFQSMLFNRPDLQIFQSGPLRQQTLKYLKDFIGLAPKFGAQAMVFGSPKNRKRGDMPEPDAEEVARAFFAELGDAAAGNDTCFCIEPNPTDYGCDFITNARQGMDFVRRVGNPGFGLHLDIAGMTLAGDNIAQSIKEAGPLLKHFHISAPFLGQVEAGNGVQYEDSARALRELGYDRFVSIEMKPEAAGTNLERVRKAVEFAQSVYSS